MTLWVGLTGGIGSGKSLVAAHFSALGAPVIDADAIARALTQSGGAALPLIHAHWGDAVFDPHGQLDRTALRRLVFEHPAQKRQLEALLHPLIFSAIQAAQQQAATPCGYGIVEIPLLIEATHFQTLVARILVVDCPEPLQAKRVMQRSGLDKAAVHAIMAQQASRQQRLAVADDVVVNDGNLDDLHAAIARLHHHYQTLSRKKT